MKAVIMAGGKGTRLRPLTCDMPKPMVPIMNLPVMEHIINLLKNQGITEIAVTTFYLPDRIKDYFGNGDKWGVNLQYYIEETPLGTAGSVHNASKFLDETFLVISGDAITDFDLKKGIDFHHQNNSKGTLVLSRESIPLEYGVVITDEKGKIQRFLEKPDWGQVFSDTVNTGIYILEPDIFALYEKGIKFDFSQDLFPLMLKKDMNLYGICLSGYWNDIGNLDQYQQTHMDFLENKINLPLPDCKEIEENIWVEEDVKIDDSVELVGPLYIGKGSKIARGVHLEKSVIGRNNNIQPYTSFKKTIVWNNNYIGRNCELRGAILSDNVTLKNRVNVFDKTAIGRKVTVGDETKINPGIKIWPERKIDSNTVVEDNIIWSPRWSKKLFSNIGVRGMSNIDISPEFVAKLATAYASTLKKGQEVVISSDNYKISSSLKRAVISGLQTAGINIIDIGNTISPVARFSVNYFEAGGGIHIRVSYKEPENTVLEYFNEFGANICSSKQKSIEKKYFAENYSRSDLDDIGDYNYIPDLNKKYIDNLIKNLDYEKIKKKYCSLVLDYEYDNLLEILPVFLKKLNCQFVSTRNFSYKDLPLPLDKRLEVSERVGRIIRDNNFDLGLIIDHNAEKLNLVDQRGKVLSRADHQVLISYILLEKGIKMLYLPLNAPRVIESMAAEYDAGIEYTPIRPQFIMNKYINGKKEFEFYPYGDAIFGLGLVLEKMALDNITFSELIEKLPDFYLDQAQIPCDWEEKGRVMRYLSKQARENTELIDGIKFNHDNGWALVIPDSEKAVFHVFAEGEDAETAESLTGFYLDRVKKIIND